MGLKAGPTPSIDAIWVRVRAHQGEAFQGFEVSEIGLSSVVFEADGQRLTRSVGASE